MRGWNIHTLFDVNNSGMIMVLDDLLKDENNLAVNTFSPSAVLQPAVRWMYQQQMRY